MDSETWDKYCQRGQIYVDATNLENEAFKLEIGRKVAEARKVVVVDGDADWASLVKRAISSILIHRVQLSKFGNWLDGSPDDALSALRVIWMQDTLSVSERIRAFSKQFPPSVISGAGTRLNVISVLLMGLDIERYPPFRVGVFNNAYDATGFGRPGRGSDEAALYEHALGFMDKFIDEADKRGLVLRNRLEAQAAIWNIPGFLEENVSPPPDDPPTQPHPDLPPLAAKLHLTPDFLREIETLLYDKKQVIFQGPPGTGKTYVAQALAEHLGGGSKNRVTLVQLHPSYAYEDFVQGFRPALIDRQASFQLKDGPLLRAAENARTEPNAKHFLVIDEINRGNPAKVFGELYFLLEYRDKAIDLQYRGEDDPPFSLPDNLYIIGTMNTADRSIALVDLALRRRFYFVEFHPDDEPVKDVLSLWLEANDLDMEWLADVVKLANEKMKNDRHAAIGPSYFMKDGLDEKAVRRIWKHSVRPYIEERRFGEGDLGQFDLDTLREEVRRNRDGEDGEPQADADSGVETVDGSAQ